MQSTIRQHCAPSFHPAATPTESDEPLLLASATAVSGNVDLVAEILRCLPIKSLVRAKIVSKQWLSLIESPFFASLRNPNPNLPTGLFFNEYCQHHNPTGQLCYVPFDTNNYRKFDVTAREALAFFNDENPNLFIRQACNGLLLCNGRLKPTSEWTGEQIFYFVNPTTRQLRATHPIFYVVNPTTKQLRATPPLSPGSYCWGATLAFDPSKSSHYKLVVVLYFDDFEIAIYSSKTSKWRMVKVSDFPLAERNALAAGNGVFWNGAINWFSPLGKSSVYFNAEEESLHMMPMPPIPLGMGLETVRYFGEYRGHLYLALLLREGMEFTIYEMKRDYSSWFVKYSVHFNEFVAAFPDVEYPCFMNSSDLGMVVGMENAADNDGEWLLFVQHKPCKVVSYNFKHKKFEAISPFSNILSSSSGAIVVNGWSKFYPYIESLSHV